MRNSTISFGSITFFHCNELSFGILFQSNMFVGTWIDDRVDLFGELRWCFIVDCNSLWYYMVTSCFITFPVLKSPFNLSTSARSDRC